jgi:cytochrome c oxidase cbb3-type subunit 3
MAPQAGTRVKWLLIAAGLAVAVVIGTLVALLSLPRPVPGNATRAQRLYLTYCAACHGADGRGSWRATLFLMRPPNLADARTLNGRSDDYLFDLFKQGGASIGKPGMPAFGYSLTDEQIGELVRYVRALSSQPARK